MKEINLQDYQIETLVDRLKDDIGKTLMESQHKNILKGLVDLHSVQIKLISNIVYSLKEYGNIVSEDIPNKLSSQQELINQLIKSKDQDISLLKGQNEIMNTIIDSFSEDKKNIRELFEHINDLYDHIGK